MVDIVASESFSLGCSKPMLFEENAAKLIDTAKRVVVHVHIRQQTKNIYPL